MSNVSARAFNESFVMKASTAEGKEKIAEYAGSVIRDRLREVCFADKIVPPETVVRADCQVSVNHDSLIKIVSIEPKSRAVSTTFRGQPSVNFLRGPRVECAFYTIMTEMIQKTEQELMVYDYPITKVVEDNSIKDLGEVKDREWLLTVEACVQALQVEANAGSAVALNATNIALSAVVEFSVRKGELARNSATNTAVVQPVQRNDYVNLFKMLDGRRLRSERVLVTEVDWDDHLQWTAEDNGHKLQSETTIEGYKYNTVLGRNFVRTIKTDILRPGNIYCFTAPEFFAKSFILNQTKFYIDKIANLITFQAWMDVGTVCVNVAAVKKLELYSGDAGPTTNADSLISNFIPVDEEDLGAVNNRVDSGLRFPQIVSF